MATANHQIYTENVEPQALTQFYDAMNHDAVIQGALMPDAHTGYTVPIGSVIKTQGVVVPSWIGYDIGCSVSALHLVMDPAELKEHATEIRAAILKRIPVGFNVHARTHRNIVTRTLSPVGQAAVKEKSPDCSVGTLGGGNHFIELGVLNDEQVVLTIHSGSRGPGHAIASAHMAIAANGNSNVEGTFVLDIESEEGKAYIEDARWAAYFAQTSHFHMQGSVILAIRDLHLDCAPNFSQQMICQHNMFEINDATGAVIHRKGATHVPEGQFGLIPGNMRDGVAVVIGKGSVDAMDSCSHGAGRKYSRRAAKRELSIEDFERSMSGIAADVSPRTIDESPAAYKDFSTVLVEQSDLVDVRGIIKPVVNVKG